MSTSETHQTNPLREGLATRAVPQKNVPAQVPARPAVRVRSAAAVSRCSGSAPAANGAPSAAIILRASSGLCAPSCPASTIARSC